MVNDFHLTAITRNKLSAPTKFLMEHGLLVGSILGFGSGKGFDTKKLSQLGYDIESYDVYYQPIKPKRQFDTIICNYVLNVVESNQWPLILNEIGQCLKKHCMAYITVRRDIKVEGYRKHRKGTTYQVNVELDLPKLVENCKYCIYILKKAT